MRRDVVSYRLATGIAFMLALAAPAQAYEEEVNRLSRDLAVQLGSRGAKTVAVVDFTDLRGEVNELGRFLAEELSVALTRSAEGFAVIDRTRLAIVFAEHNLSASGLIASEEAKRLGQLVGADVLVSATMTPFGESVRLSVKALDTETATLRASALGNVPRTGAIDELLRRGMGERRSGTGGGTHRAASAGAVEPVKAKSFVFELESCRLSGRTAECLILVVNQAADRVLWLGDRSRLFDGFGNEYSPRRLRLANTEQLIEAKRSRRVAVAGSRRSIFGVDGVEKLMIQGVVTQVALTFEGVDVQATEVSQLYLELMADDTSFDVRFRDILFSADGD